MADNYYKCDLMIMAVLFFPKIKIFSISLGSCWVVTVIGAIVLLLCNTVDITTIVQDLIADTAINPLKILVLFISMTILSIFLDKLGFFRYLANLTLTKTCSSQLKLFMILYITLSVLNTSNDIIILSFTPFICYFARSAKISPMIHLAAEFGRGIFNGCDKIHVICSNSSAARYCEKKNIPHSEA